MADFAVWSGGLFSTAVFVTLVVMLFRRNGEIKKEKFEKRDW